MKRLLEAVEALKSSEIKHLIDARMREFKKNRKEIFSELCFCILTANFNAEKSIEIQSRLKNAFSTFPESELAKELKRLGHRYPSVRAKYIVKAKKHKEALESIVSSYDEKAIMEWLVKNISGIGYKEASHFLRNIGFTNLAIVDFHILNLLARHGLIEKPKTLTRKKYLEIEEVLRAIAEKLDLNLAELDLYLSLIHI